MFARRRRKIRFLLALGDIIAALITFHFAYETRLHLPLERVFFIPTPTKVLLWVAAALLWPGVGLWLRVYDRVLSERRWSQAADTFRQCAFAAVGMVLLEYSLRLDLSRPFLGLWFVYNFLLLTLGRAALPGLARWVRREWGEPLYVLIAGTGERARRLGETLERSGDYGIRLVGFLAVEPGDAPSTIHLSRPYPVYPATELPKLLERHVIDELIFAVDSRSLAELEDVFLMCDLEGVRTRLAVDFLPHVHSRVYLDRLQNVPLLTFSGAPDDELLLLMKRFMDVVLASVALVLLAPLMLLVALLVRLTSPGPVIFRQVRCGLNGRRFVLYKFRSMYENAEALKPALAELSIKRVAFKIPNDPRVTPLGRVLRRFSIDEWPQLWNVLKGDMSLVGPRPPVPEEVERYERWQRRRLRMRPGLTCLWALEGRDELDFETWMRKDLEYIDNWSLWLDVKILLKTIPRVLTGKGAY